MYVWEVLGQDLGVDGIVRRLVDEFDVEGARAADEVVNLVKRPRTEGLLVS